MFGNTDGRVIAHGLSVGGANFIQKPFTVDGLARKVRDALKKPANGSKLLQKFDIQSRL
jgi:predicted HD phosphohydrolase